MTYRVGITGEKSSITRAFIKSVAADTVTYGTVDTLPHDLDRYLLCAGILIGKQVQDMRDDEAAETFRVNFTDVVRFCDKVFSENKYARICVIGSESGYKGSYDMAYAGSKAALQLYVETKKLESSEQHLVCVAPTIIEDSGMTQRRPDLDAVLKRGRARRMGRWLQAEEVARAAHFALNESMLCNTVIRLTGGNW